MGTHARVTDQPRQNKALRPISYSLRSCLVLAVQRRLTLVVSLLRGVLKTQTVTVSPHFVSHVGTYREISKSGFEQAETQKAGTCQA